MSYKETKKTNKHWYPYEDMGRYTTNLMPLQSTTIHENGIDLQFQKNRDGICT